MDLFISMGDYLVLWVTMGGRWIVLPQKDNGLVVDEESHSKIKIRDLSELWISKI